MLAGAIIFVVTAWALAPGVLRTGRNDLRIDSRSTTPDDVSIGEIAIIGRPRAEWLSEVSLDVSVHDAGDGRAVPSRLTVSDARGVLMALGAQILLTDVSNGVVMQSIVSACGIVLLVMFATWSTWIGQASGQQPKLF